MNWNIFADAIVMMVSAIVPVMNPIGCALILPRLTRGASKRERMALARSIGCYTLATLLAAMWLGPALIHLLGLSAAALRVAGGALVFAQAWRLLDDVAGGKAGQSAGLASAAFVPLTVPFTIGPGTMVLAMGIGAGAMAPAGSIAHVAGATVGALVLAIVVTVLYASAEALIARIGPSPARVLALVASLLLLAVGAEMLLRGIRDAFG